MNDDVAKVLISREKIAQRVGELGRQIAGDLASITPEGEIVLMPILTGSVIFVADLMRELPHKVRLSLVAVRSYPGKSTRSAGPRLVGELPENLEGKHVLVVDDILDSGQTISFIRRELSRRGAASVRVCVLLRKTTPIGMGTPCEYVGFDIPEEFVVGYGLDYDNYYRNLPDICTLREEAM